MVIRSLFVFGVVLATACSDRALSEGDFSNADDGGVLGSIQANVVLDTPFPNYVHRVAIDDRGFVLVSTVSGGFADLR